MADVEMPHIGDDEVLVRVRAASVHPDVWHVIVGEPKVLRLMGAGLRRPKSRIPGTDMAGTVHAIGARVTGFVPGDDVFGETVRGMQWHNGGAYAEYVAVPEDAIVAKPVGVSFDAAATVPTAGLIALNNLPPSVGADTRVLVNGGAGGVGSIVVQLAKAAGAHVTGVDSASRQAFMRSCGADEVIDYTVEDFTRGSERYDVIIDIPGNRSFRECQRVMVDGGAYVLIGHDQFGATGHRWFGAIPKFLALMARTPFASQLHKPDFSSIDKRRGLTELAELLASGALTPSIGATFSLPEVPAAIDSLVEGTTIGRIVIAVDGD